MDAQRRSFYILTATPPPIPPLSGSFTRAHLGFHAHQRGVVRIEVEPWVSEKAVARIYREVRARVLPHHDERPRGMAVWRFVESQHANPRPTLSTWGGNSMVARRPNSRVRHVPFLEIWRTWRAAHPEISTLTMAESFRRWNADMLDKARQQFRNYAKFRAALQSGIEHMNTIAWPGYDMLARNRQATSLQRQKSRDLRRGDKQQGRFAAVYPMCTLARGRPDSSGRLRGKLTE